MSVEREQRPVIIAGGGPVGLSLALGLARQGVRSVVLEKEPVPDPHSRALGVLTRTLEIFRSWGVLDDFLAAGQLLTEVPVYLAGRHTPEAVVNLGVLSRATATPGLLILSQSETEGILARQVEASGLAEVRRGHAVTAFREEPDGIEVHVTPVEGEPYRAPCAYLAGCDGAHSAVRTGLGWQLEGKTYPGRVALADIRLADERDHLPWPRVWGDNDGVMGALRFQAGHWRIIWTVEPEKTDAAATTDAEVGARVDRLFGAGPFESLWASAFRIHCRTSPHFRSGRVFLAGDAAHINSPAGGQGMNSGIHDAHNLAWKLARHLHGGTEALLASYEPERRGAVLTGVERYTDFLTRGILLARPWVRTGVLQAVKAALSSPWVLERLAERAGMLDGCYCGSPLLRGGGRWIGRRAPDGELAGPEGEPRRLLDLAGPDPALLLFDDGRLPGWNTAEVEREVAGEGLRVVRIGPFAGPGPGDYRDPGGLTRNAWGLDGETAALIRPDGIVGWVAERPSAEALRSGVREALGMPSLL